MMIGVQDGTGGSVVMIRWRYALAVLALTLVGCGGDPQLAVEQPSETARAPQQAQLECDGPTPMIESGHLDYEAGAKGQEEDPVETVRVWLGAAGEDLQLREVDAPVRGGTVATVAIEKGSSVVGLVWLESARDATYLVSGFRFCSGEIAIP